MKKVVIIYGHPYERSFNHAILEQVLGNLKEHQMSYDLLDLYQEKFDPTYSKQELALFHDGRTEDPLVMHYLHKIQKATTIIFITPIWWNDLPAMMKGFVDKVMKEGEGLSHTVTKTGVRGLLTNLKHAYVLTTSTSPTFYFKFFCGNGIQHIFLNHTLKQLGIHHRHWQNFGGISTASETRRKAYLQKIRSQDFY